jgi:hypothetical protein
MEKLSKKELALNKRNYFRKKIQMIQLPSLVLKVLFFRH